MQKKLLIIVFLIAGNIYCWSKPSNDVLLDSITAQMQTKLEAEDYYGVLEDVSLALKIKPDYTFAYHFYGVANFSLHRYANSLYGFTELLRLDSETSITYSNRGGMYAFLGYDILALADLNYALDEDDEEHTTYINRSNIFINHGHWEEANNDLLLAEKYGGISPELYCNKANIQLYMSNPRGALQFCDLALNENPKYAIGIQTKLEILYQYTPPVSQLLYTKDIFDILNENVLKNPSDYTSFYCLGVAYKILHKRDKASINLQTAITLLDGQILLFPDSYTLIYQRACAYEMMNNVVEARKDFERVKEINPEFPPLEEKLKRL